MEEKKRKREELWHRHGYTSLNMALESSSGSEEEEEEDEEARRTEEEFLGMVPPDNEIHYLIGDVTQPQCAGEADAIVVWCSGGCGYGCVFAIIIATSHCRQFWPVGEAWCV